MRGHESVDDDEKPKVAHPMCLERSLAHPRGKNVMAFRHLCRQMPGAWLRSTILWSCLAEQRLIWQAQLLGKPLLVEAQTVKSFEFVTVQMSLFALMPISLFITCATHRIRNLLEPPPKSTNRARTTGRCYVTHL